MSNGGFGGIHDKLLASRQPVDPGLARGLRPSSRSAS
jgi:hypothetical protein